MEYPSAWVHRVAFNLANSHFRRASALRRAHARFSAAQGSPESDFDTAEQVTVRESVASLPEKQRQALVLRYFADMSVRDVAEIMRCPENTVKTHTRRAIEALRGRALLDDATLPQEEDVHVD
jgi:RNA polymerase sigma-70 factor (ECF subfamily)